jgi:hypothetical protein
VIFTNVPYETVDGKRKWLAENFMLLGAPVQISIGFIDADGNFRRHPNEPPISTYGTVPPDFTGILGALTQETMKNGDFFQGTFVGFEYLLDRYHPQEDFPLKENEPVTRALARILRWVATRRVLHTTSKYKKIQSGEATIPIPVLRAMGVMEPDSNRILSTEEIRDKIIMMDMPKYPKTPSAARRTIRHGWDVPTWYTFNDLLDIISRDTNTDIYFNEYGRMVVSGKARVGAIANTKYDRTRVHDAIIGNNVLHHQATIDLFQIKNRVVVHKVFSGINAESPSTVVVHPNAGVMFERDDVTKYYADDESFGRGHIYTYAESEPYEEDASSVIEQIIEYFRYYGMRGTVFMMGNPKIRCGDVLRLTDIRSFGITGISDKTVIDQLSKEIQYTANNTSMAGDPAGDSEFERSFRLKNLIDHYYIWKVVHYIGPDGFKTKIFYTKERDSYVPGSDLLNQHIRRRRRGIAGDVK